MIQIRQYIGNKIEPLLGDLGRLRMQIFRDFPYLYDGDLHYEEIYLRRYVQSERSMCVVAYDDERVVGAATGMPLDDELASLKQPFKDKGFDPASIFYFGESVLLPEYRGQKLGHQFFDCREAHAQLIPQIRHTAFSSVMRAMDHPARPNGYQPLNAFWQARGYRRVEEIQCKLAWKDIGDASESSKSLTVWMRELPQPSDSAATI